MRNVRGQKWILVTATVAVAVMLGACVSPPIAGTAVSGTREVTPTPPIQAAGPPPTPELTVAPSTPTPEATPSPSPTASPTPRPPTPTATPVSTPVATVTTVPTPAPTPSPAPTPTVAPSMTIAIRSQSFPVEVEIAATGSVTWVNMDPQPHTVTSTTGLFDSGYLIEGRSWGRTFMEPGTYRYKCLVHPWMQGAVIVR